MAQKNTARVITIAATEQPQDIRLRVAAYARVSSSSDEQLNSFAAQNRYYTELISGKDNWQLVDIYADEGITGTSIESRNDFKRMLRDCERGLVDRILVKSISRFARNTTECLETVRSLKARGVSVYFEKEGIDTGNVSGEMLTAVFASLAQAESESISKNMRWSYQKRMQMGTFIPTHLPYGYCRFGCKIAIVDAEAEIVKRIFSEYLMGKNMEQIATSLNIDGIPFNNRGTLRNWSKYTVGHILENEKYIGDSLWQKTYYTSTLPRYQKKNLGEMPQYYAQNTHPAIIDSETYTAAQKLRSSKTDNRQVMCPEKQYMFNGKLICGNCGSPFRVKNSRTLRYWMCLNRASGKDNCTVPQIPESEIVAAFLRLCNKLQYNKFILKDTLEKLNTIQNRRMLWSPDIIELNKKISEIIGQNQMLAVLKQQGLVDPDIFISKTNELAEQLLKLKLEKERLLESKTDDTLSQTKQIIEVIRDVPDFLEEFDSEMFDELIDKIIVEDNTHLRFRLKNGLEFRETIRRAVR